MEKEQIKNDVDLWIAAEDLPQGGLKVLRGFDAYEGMDDDEIEAYLDYRHWYMSKDYALLLTIPKPIVEFDFWPEADDANSFAFGSMDFQRLKGELNKHHYRLKTIFERVVDLAQTFSCLRDTAGRSNIKKRYEELVNFEFRREAIELATTFSEFKAWMNPDKVNKRLKYLYLNIGRCESHWHKHAEE